VEWTRQRKNSGWRFVLCCSFFHTLIIAPQDPTGFQTAIDRVWTELATAESSEEAEGLYILLVGSSEDERASGSSTLTTPLLEAVVVQ